METNKKAKVKFNFFDVTVIIIIALLITGIAYIYFLGSDGSAASNDGVNIEYKLEMEMLDESFGDLIKVGDYVVDNATGNRIGKVTGIEISDYKNKANYSGDEGGEYFNAVDGYINITLTVDCNGKWDGDTTVITNNCRIMLGSVIEAHTPKLTFTANCTMMRTLATDGEEVIDNEA